MKAALRFWQTVKHLKPIQIYGRVAFRLARPNPDVAPPPGLRLQSGGWELPARRRQSMSGPDEFVFLNEVGRLSSLGWDDPAKAKLWRYNQHYFDDLNAVNAGDRTEWHRKLIDHWIASNPPGKGTGWEPYPLSLRIVNWVKWALAGHELSDEAIHSLAIQVRWLTRRMEWHLLGNHLFANAKALVFAGLFFDGPEAASWLEQGRQILAKEIPEQILDDGGQFELSPMYHALAVEDMLDLVNIAQACAQADFTKALNARIPAMIDWLLAMSHPDGGLSFFNDTALGIAPDNSELVDYAARLGFNPQQAGKGVVHLASSGYARIAGGPAVLIADLARIGPDYLPGHAHADTLSFELSLFGQRVVGNSGTSVYGLGEERLRQRGTAAHSTVTVVGQNSSDVWSGFRVGRRARPFSVSVTRANENFDAEASHDGYRFLAGQPVHSRSWKLDENQLVVSDTLTCAGLAAEARFHIHPDVHLIQDGKADGRLVLSNGTLVKWHCERGLARVEASSWHPEFGKSIACSCLVILLDGGSSKLVLDWQKASSPHH